MFDFTIIYSAIVNLTLDNVLMKNTVILAMIIKYASFS